jgi:hypothetical protein
MGIPPAAGTAGAVHPGARRGRDHGMTFQLTKSVLGGL